MSIKKKTAKGRKKRILRQKRGRKKITGSETRPRLNIFKGSRSLYAQVIDDFGGKTLLGVGSNSKEARDKVKGNGKKAAEELGSIVAAKCREKNISSVIFDKGGYKYHGVIKAFAESVRKNGIKF